VNRVDFRFVRALRANRSAVQGNLFHGCCQSIGKCRRSFFNPQTGPVVDRFHIHGPPRKEDAKPEPALVRLPPRSLSSRPHFKSYLDHTAIAHAICKAQGESKSEELETGLPVTTRCRFRKNELKRSHHFDSSQNLATSLPAAPSGFSTNNDTSEFGLKCANALKQISLLVTNR
jgi:hypothetical protein